MPLLHRTYAGNTPDAPTFASLTDALAARYRDICRAAEHITLVFDKGNNSKDNLQAVAESPYRFIGSLVPAQHPDLLKTPARKLRPLDGDGLPGVSAWRTVRTVLGAQRTVLVTYNENLFAAQSQTLLRRNRQAPATPAGAPARLQGGAAAACAAPGDRPWKASRKRWPRGSRRAT